MELFLTSPEFRPLRELIRFNPQGAQLLQDSLRSLSPVFHNVLVENPEIAQEILEGTNEFSEKQIQDMHSLQKNLKSKNSFKDDPEDSWEDVEGSEEQNGSLGNSETERG